MTEERIPSKWTFITNWLKELKAPKKVVNAAIAIDDALEDLGLGYNTQEWEKYYDSVPIWDHTRLTVLYRVIVDDKFCTACEDCEDICRHCKLGVSNNCTPRYRHADKYFSIVKGWLKRQAYP